MPGRNTSCLVFLHQFFEGRKVSCLGSGHELIVGHEFSISGFPDTDTGLVINVKHKFIILIKLLEVSLLWAPFWPASSSGQFPFLFIIAHQAPVLNFSWGFPGQGRLAHLPQTRHQGHREHDEAQGEAPRASPPAHRHSRSG